MPQRNYIKTKEKVSKPSKRIVLASDLERYKEIVDVCFSQEHLAQI